MRITHHPPSAVFPSRRANLAGLTLLLAPAAAPRPEGSATLRVADPSTNPQCDSARLIIPIKSIFVIIRR